MKTKNEYKANSLEQKTGLVYQQMQAFLDFYCERYSPEESQIKEFETFHECKKFVEGYFNKRAEVGSRRAQIIFDLTGFEPHPQKLIIIDNPIKTLHPDANSEEIAIFEAYGGKEKIVNLFAPQQYLPYNNGLEYFALKGAILMELGNLRTYFENNKLDNKQGIATKDSKIGWDEVLQFFDKFLEFSKYIEVLSAGEKVEKKHSYLYQRFENRGKELGEGEIERVFPSYFNHIFDDLFEKAKKPEEIGLNGFYGKDYPNIFGENFYLRNAKLVFNIDNLTYNTSIGQLNVDGITNDFKLLLAGDGGGLPNAKQNLIAHFFNRVLISFDTISSAYDIATLLKYNEVDLKEGFKFTPDAFEKIPIYNTKLLVDKLIFSGEIVNALDEIENFQKKTKNDKLYHNSYIRCVRPFNSAYGISYDDERLILEDPKNQDKFYLSNKIEFQDGDLSPNAIRLLDEIERNQNIKTLDDFQNFKNECKFLIDSGISSDVVAKDLYALQKFSAVQGALYQLVNDNKDPFKNIDKLKDFDNIELTTLTSHLILLSQSGIGGGEIVKLLYLNAYKISPELEANIKDDIKYLFSDEFKSDKHKNLEAFEHILSAYNYPVFLTQAIGIFIKASEDAVNTAYPDGNYSEVAKTLLNHLEIFKNNKIVNKYNKYLSEEALATGKTHSYETGRRSMNINGLLSATDFSFVNKEYFIFGEYTANSYNNINQIGVQYGNFRNIEKFAEEEGLKIFPKTESFIAYKKHPFVALSKFINESDKDNKIILEKIKNYNSEITLSNAKILQEHGKENFLQLISVKDIYDYLIRDNIKFTEADFKNGAVKEFITYINSLDNPGKTGSFIQNLKNSPKYNVQFLEHLSNDQEIQTIELSIKTKIQQINISPTKLRPGNSPE